MSGTYGTKVTSDNLTKIGIGGILAFIAALVVIELSKDEADRSGVGGAVGLGSGSAAVSLLVE